MPTDLPSRPGTPGRVSWFSTTGISAARQRSNDEIGMFFNTTDGIDRPSYEQ